MGDSGGAGRALLDELWETPTVRLETSDSSASTVDAKPRRVSRRSEQRAAAHASRFVELEVEADEDRREQERRRIMLAAAFGHSNSSRESASAMRRRCSYPFAPEQTDGSRSSSSDGFDAATGNSPAANTAPVPLVVREKGFRLVRRGSDPLVNDEFYATQMQVGNFVKMGWLTKQGHSWKTWKTRFFVLFSDGTFAYYKSKGRKRIKGCIQLNDGVVSVQHVDVRRADKPYVFQVEKGFYRLICYCCSQFEAELWVSALRAVRRSPPPCPEIDLTAQEEKAGSNAVSRHMNKIFIADQHIADKVALFKSNEIDHSFASIQNFIVELDDIIIDRYHLEFYQDEAIEMLPGNDLVRLIRRNVEDRIFLPLYAQAYSSLETYRLRVARGRTYKNRKVFQTKPQEYFGVPAQLAQIYEWTDVVMIINTLDCVSLPTHKLEVIVVAGKLIADTIAQRNGKFFDLADETLTAIFRYVLSRSSLEDLPILRALLKSCYVYHPACLNNTNVVEAFLDAIKWIEGFESEGEISDRLNPWTLAASRVSVTISTNDVGIQLTNDGNGRGAIVYSIRKQSQAALSAAIVPGLALIAINHEPVVLMSFHDVVRKLRTAPLPKTLTFLTEFYYYQLLSLDAEMFQYLTCAAASRGDKETLTWLRGWCHVDLNQLCSWEKSRGKQIFGFEPASAKGTALHAAAHSGQSVMVKHLLGLGADPNQCDRKLKRPLHVVKQSVDIALIIQLLVDSGADIDAQQQKGLTPLMGMCARGSLEGAATLLALGADIHRIAWSTGFSALEFAVVGGFVDIVELCLSKGADPNSPTLDGNTSVHLSAAAANPEILLTLLQNGGDPNTRNRFGQSPIGVLLSLASQLDRGRVSLCLDVLVTAGCRLETRDIYGRHAGHQVMILGDAGLKDQVLEDTHNTSIDIFGCTAEDYGEPALNESSIMELTAANALDFWRVDESSTKASSHPHTVDDLVEGLVGIGTLNLADVLAFVLSLDTLSSLDDVLDCIGKRVNHRQNGYGIIRLYVLVQLFKPALAGKLQNLVDRFYSLASQVLATDSDALAAMVDEYKSLYHRCFQLSGTRRVLKSYAAIPSIMEKRYSTNDSCNFDPAHQFSQRFHQFVQAENWAEHVTLITHALFCSIPVQEFTLTGSKHEHSPQFVSAKRWFQHLSAYVVNAVLSQDTPQDRAEVVTFFLAAAEHLSVLHNYDSLAAILYALQSTAVQRLRRTIECMSVEAKKLMNRMQVLSDKGCREMNRLMRKAPSPCMPYIGLCLQNFVGLNELPVFDSVGAVNTNRLHRMGVLLVEIFHRQTLPYALRYDESVDNLLHVSLPFDSEESRYQRSLELEPREAGAAPLSDRGSYVTVEDLDIESEVRESIGGEGTFGLRQWFRKQKLVHRNRSRSSVVANYEWV